MEISFKSVHTGTVSIIGKQSGTEVRDYKTSNGRSQALLTNGSASTEDMILDAQNANKMMLFWVSFSSQKPRKLIPAIDFHHSKDTECDGDSGF